MRSMRETSGKIISMDEQALIHDAQAGNLEAFNTLILHYQDSIYNTALRILGDEDLAADSTQEAFISAFKSISSFRGGSFKAWLMRTVTNACYDELRRQKRRPTTPLEPEAHLRDFSLGRFTFEVAVVQASQSSQEDSTSAAP